MVPAAGLSSVCLHGGKRTGKMTEDHVLQDHVSEPLYLQQQGSSAAAATKISGHKQPQTSAATHISSNKLSAATNSSIMPKTVGF
jgi:hypothetical protein